MSRMYINRIDTNTKDDKRFTCSPVLFKNYEYNSISHEKRGELGVKHNFTPGNTLFLEKLLTKSGNPIGVLRDVDDKHETRIGKFDDCIQTFFTKSPYPRFYKMITNDNLDKIYESIFLRLRVRRNMRLSSERYYS